MVVPSRSIRFDSLLPLMRQDGSEVKAYLSVMTGREVVRGTILNTQHLESYAAVLNLGLTSFFYTLLTGNASEIKPGMRTVVYENDGGNPGRIKAVHSISSYGTISSNTLTVREFTDAYSWVDSGDFVIVYEDIVLGDKLVGGTDAFNPDLRPYSDENEVGYPVPHSGGWWAGYINEQSGVADVQFFSQEAYTTDNNGMPTNLWVCAGATFTGGTHSTSNDPILRFTTPGMYMLYHTATHPVTGKQKLAMIPIRVHQKGVDEPYDVTLESLSGTVEQGWEAKVRIYENASITDIPDGAPVILWTEHTIGGLTFNQPLLYSYTRTHILMVGYMRRDTTTITPKQQYVTFDIINPMQVMREMAGFSKVMLYDANPDAWSEFSRLTVWRAIIQIASQYTFLIEAGFDLKRSMNDFTYPRFYLDKNTPLEQMAELAAGVDGRMVCGRFGHVQNQKRAELQTALERVDDDIWITLTEDDIYAGVDGSEGLEIVREHYRPLDMLKLNALAVGATPDTPQPLFSRYPGTPGRGSQNETVEKIIGSDQNSINERCGLYGAFYDRIYQRLDGIIERAPSVRLSLRGPYWTALDLLGGRIMLDIPDNLNPRGVPLDRPFIVDSIEMSIEDGAMITRLELRGDTYSVSPGDTWFPPEDRTSPRVVTPPDMSWIDPILNNPTGDWNPVTQTFPTTVKALSGTSAQFAYAEVDFNYGSTAWTENSSGLSGASPGIWFQSDPFNSRRIFGLFQDGLYKIDDYETSTWTLVTTYANIFGDTYANRPATCFEMSLTRGGFLIAASGKNLITWSANYGLTWNQVLLFGVSYTAATYPTQATNTFNDHAHVTISPHNTGSSTVGWVYATTKQSAGTTTSEIWRSTNWGQTWTQVGTTGAGTVPMHGAGQILIPYLHSNATANNNLSYQDIFWWGPGTGATKIGKSVTAGASTAVFKDAAAFGASYEAGTGQGPRGFAVFPSSAQYMALLVITSTANVAEAIGIARSSNHGSSWTGPTDLTAQIGKVGHYGNVGMFSLNTNALLVFGYAPNASGGATGGIGMSADFGATWFGFPPDTFPLLMTANPNPPRRPVICAELGA